MTDDMELEGRAFAWCAERGLSAEKHQTSLASLLIEVRTAAEAEVARLREREVDVARALGALGENRVDLPRIARNVVAEVERLREQFLAENRDALEQEARAKKAEAEVERLRDEIAAVKTDNYRINRHRDECEAEVERLTQERSCTGCDSPLPILCRECYRKDMEETRQRAEQAEAELAALRAIAEEFAADLESAPSTRLLGQELRNRLGEKAEREDDYIRIYREHYAFMHPGASETVRRADSDDFMRRVRALRGEGEKP
jgi:hypothetical protein